MATFIQLKDRAKRLALTNDDTEAGLIVNDVYRDIVVQTQTKVTSATVNLTAGDNTVTLGISDLGMIQQITYKANGQTQSYVLEPSSLEEVIQLSALNPTGIVTKYFLNGLDELYLWPAPQDNGDTLTVYYAQTPFTLVNSTPGAGQETTPSSIPSQWHHLISLGAAARLADAIGEDIALGANIQQRYDVTFSRYVAWLNRRKSRGTQRFATGYVRNVGFRPHDRSTYFSGDWYT